MSEYILSCCSTADLSKQDFLDLKVEYIPFHVYIDGQHYYDDPDNVFPPKKLYSMMLEGKDVKTSQINSEEFIEHFTKFLKQGKDILHIAFSSGLSGVYESAARAQRELQKQFPERKIYVVDSLGGATGQGLIMDKLSELKNAMGYSIDQLQGWIEKNKLRLHHWFTSTDLTFFVKGGRISKAAGFIGNILKICPVLNVDKLGKLRFVSKVRSKQKALAEMLKRMLDHAQDGQNYNQKCFISHSECYDDAAVLANWIESKFTKLTGKVKIHNIGPTLGCHCGPGTIALFFWGDER